ncbi:MULTISPECIES: DUF485 domain-containing protein [unclassified Streptomyces]|uniref:DUF485 domain-containing protein n=1 Tax=unclassified Streptomyces TaxID=2593676 RepID=UPI00331D2CA0
MSHGAPPPSPYSSWPGRLPQQPPRHRPPHDPDHLPTWQGSGPPAPDDPSGPPPSVPGRHSDLRRLRTSYRSLRRVAVLTALGYFVVFLLLSGFAKDLMGRPLFAGLNVGLALGLCQVPVTVLAVVRYERTARRTVDPLAARLRRAGEAR